jgi:glycosyltransferase involved in cell wall biosynthesis
MDRPLSNVSILMLAKDSEKTLRQAATSVLYDDTVELVIIEPGSSDNSRQIAIQIQSEYGARVKLIIKPDNSPAEGLNNGLRAATGEIIGVLNADDLYLPNALKYVRTYFLQNPSADILMGSGIIVNEINHSCKNVYPSWINTNTLRYSRIGALTFFHQGMFFRKKISENSYFNEENKVNWDYEFLALLYSKNPKIAYSNRKLAIFRIHPNSITFRQHQKAGSKSHPEYNNLQFLHAFIYRVTKAIRGIFLTFLSEIFLDRNRKW